jgi:AbrB family looped-hinge helix DNA binding protein
MLRTKVDADFRVVIPEELRQTLQVGDELLISADEEGRLIIVPEARIRSILQRTAGMWRGRADIPADSVEYVNQMRQARRLHDQGIMPDGD